MDAKILMQDLSAGVSVRSGLQKKDAENFVRTFFEVVEQSLQMDKIVKVKGLGTFKVVEVSGRNSVNVNTGERIHIKGHSKVSFTPDSAIKDHVNRPFADFETIILNDGVDIAAMEFVDVPDDITLRPEDEAYTLRPEDEDYTLRPEEDVTLRPEEDVTLRPKEEDVTLRPEEEDITLQPVEGGMPSQEEEGIQHSKEEDIEYTEEEPTLHPENEVILQTDEEGTLHQEDNHIDTTISSEIQDDATVRLNEMDTTEHSTLRIEEDSYIEETHRMPDPIVSEQHEDTIRITEDSPLQIDEQQEMVDTETETVQMQDEPSPEENEIELNPKADEILTEDKNIPQDEDVDNTKKSETEFPQEETLLDEEPPMLEETSVETEDVELTTEQQFITSNSTIIEEPIKEESQNIEEQIVEEEQIADTVLETEDKSEPERTREEEQIKNPEDDTDSKIKDEENVPVRRVVARRPNYSVRPRYVASHTTRRQATDDEVETLAQHEHSWGATILKILLIICLMTVSYWAGTLHLLGSKSPYDRLRMPGETFPSTTQQEPLDTTKEVSTDEDEDINLDDPYKYNDDESLYNAGGQSSTNPDEFSQQTEGITQKETQPTVTQQKPKPETTNQVKQAEKSQPAQKTMAQGSEAQQTAKNQKLTTSQQQTKQSETTYPQVKGGLKIVGVKCAHRVKAGQGVYSIARQYYGDPKMGKYIITMNKLSNPNIISVGQVLQIPELAAQ